MASSFNQLTDISKFLPSNVDTPTILEILYEERQPMSSNDFQSYLDLPLSENYKKNLELKDENKSNVSLIESRDVATQTDEEIKK